VVRHALGELAIATASIGMVSSGVPAAVSPASEGRSAERSMSSTVV